MTDTTPFGFGKLVPGFDFLQNLASSAVKGAQQGLPNMPSLSSWVAPTLSVEEIDKRITELKAVQFWLDQNARALAATPDPYRHLLPLLARGGHFRNVVAM